MGHYAVDAAWLVGAVGIRDVVVLHLEGLVPPRLPLPLTLHVCMAAHSNEVTKNVRNAMLMLK